MAPRINLPPLTRGLIIALVILSLLNAAARYRSWEVDKRVSLSDRQYYAPYITIIPGMSVAYPWVFVTATFAEQNPIGLLITGVTIFYGGRYLERAWSSAEYTKFIALVCLVPNILSFLAYVSLYVITRNPSLATTSISGGIAIQAGFLVSFKQLVPEHTVSLLRGLVRVRVKHFPAIFLLANTISGIAFGTDTATLLAWIGFLTAWTYLRFYRLSPSLSSASTTTPGGSTNLNPNASDTIKGDASDTFAFAYFFPDAVHAPVATVADAVYDALVAIHICTPFTSSDIDASNEQALARGESGGLPSLLNSTGGGRSSRSGGTRQESERRRALALRALDQRLQNVRPPPAAHAAHTGRNPLGETQYVPEGEGMGPGPPAQREEMVVPVEEEGGAAVRDAEKS